MAKNLGKKSINMDIPADLYDMLRKLCVDTGLTATSIVVQYLEYLQKQHYKRRQVLNEHSESDFKLDEGKSRKLHSSDVSKQK